MKARNTEQGMFDFIKAYICNYPDAEFDMRHLAWAISQRFGLTLPQARSIRHRWLKLRKEKEGVHESK